MTTSVPPPAPAAPPAFRRTRSTLFWVLTLSVGLHVVAGLIFGSWTIYQYTRPPEAIFESPPPAVQVPPEAIEYRVQMQQMQRDSARPQNQVATQVNQLLDQQMDRVQTDVSSLVTPALTGAPVVTGGGRGGGRIGGGGGIGFGVSAVNFFGIEKQGERVVFIVDAGAWMVEPERGDLPGYDRVKAELVGMVQGLSPGTFFNVLVYERGLDVYREELVVATNDNKAGVAEWIGPYWRLQGPSIERRQTFRNNYTPDMSGLPSAGGGGRLDLALGAAFEMRADLIFTISTGRPSVQKALTPREEAALRQAQERFHHERDRLQAAREAYEQSARGQREMAEWRQAMDTWESRRKAQEADRRRRGLPPVVRAGGTSDGRPATPGPPIPVAPPRRPVTYYAPEELVTHARRRTGEIYGTNHNRWPTVNVVGYSADDRGQEFIRRLVGGFPNSTWRNIGRFDANTKF